tara:strand:- start:3380 stop:3709 length:330 start_codon:yes stop_codon:yes gene_type:complete
VTLISAEEISAMADKLDAEVFARCGVKAAEATVLRAQAARIAELEAALGPFAEKVKPNSYDVVGLARFEVWGRASNDQYRAAYATLTTSKPTPEPTAAMFGLGGDNDDF